MVAPETTEAHVPLECRRTGDRLPGGRARPGMRGGSRPTSRAARTAWPTSSGSPRRSTRWASCRPRSRPTTRWRRWSPPTAGSGRPPAGVRWARRARRARPPAPVKQDPLVSGRPRARADLVGRPALDITQRDHETLRRRQRGDRGAQDLARLLPRTRSSGVCQPIGRLAQRPGDPRLSTAGETCVLDRGPPAGPTAENGRQRRSRYARRRAMFTAIRTSHVRSKDRPGSARPRSGPRATLHDLVGDRAVADCAPSPRAGGPVVLADQGDERRLVAVAERSASLVVADIGHDLDRRGAGMRPYHPAPTPCTPLGIDWR